MQKNARLAAIEALPSEMQNEALVDWRTVADIVGGKDIEHTRETLTKAGLPVVHVTERKKLPRWGDLKVFLKNRECVGG